MSEKFENIIVGSGIAGLICGGYLAKSGQKTLILEKNRKIGGRIKQYEFDGYTGMIHGPVWNTTFDGGFWPTAARELGADISFFIAKEPKIYTKGSNQPPKFLPRSYTAPALVSYVESQFPEPLSPAVKESFNKVFTEILATPYKQFSVEMDRVSLKDWLAARSVDPVVHSFFNVLGANMIMQPDVETAGEFLSVGKVFMQTRMWLAGEGVITLPYPNMESGFVRPFADVFRSFGGEIRTEHEALEVIVEGGEAKGVLVKTKDGREERLLSDRVIVNALYTDIPKLFKKIPPELEEPLRRLPETWLVDFWVFVGLREKVTDNPSYLMVHDPGTGRHLGGMWPQSLEMPWTAPPGKQLIWYERIYTKDALKRNREEIHAEMLDVMEEVYPGLKKAIEVKFFAGHGPLFHHSYSTLPKIPQKVSSPERLYFVGDSTIPQYGIATEAAASTGILCAKRILGME
jgi:phytoene dehydrogenase-like protein